MVENEGKEESFQILSFLGLFDVQIFQEMLIL